MNEIGKSLDQSGEFGSGEMTTTQNEFLEMRKKGEDGGDKGSDESVLPLAIFFLFTYREVGNTSTWRGGVSSGTFGTW
jgi:hypothetical protein